MKVAYTVCTANYLAHAKSLADSLIEENPDYQFFIGLLDKINGRFDVSFFSPHQIVEVEKWNIPFFAEMNEKYTLFELSNAMKPYFADYLIKTLPNIDILIYLDSDMLVFSSFAFIEKQLQNYSICLTPHILTPIPQDNNFPKENTFLNAGIYNGGFLAMKPDKNGLAFVKWWKEVLKDYCLVKVEQGLFVDQLWLNLVPIFFEKVYTVRKLGYNVAYYNLHERHLTIKQGKYWVNENDELVIYHYTGYNIQSPDNLSNHQNRFSFNYRSDVQPLFDLYNKILAKNKKDLFENLEYYYGYIKQTLRMQEEEQQARKKLLEETQIKEAQEQFWQDIVALVKKEVNRESKRLNSQKITTRIKAKIKHLFT